MVFFFFNDTATTEIYTLSLHDALPILGALAVKAPEIIRSLGLDKNEIAMRSFHSLLPFSPFFTPIPAGDRKSTRLNSSHGYISYAVFCLKKKKRNIALWPHETDYDAQIMPVL